MTPASAPTAFSLIATAIAVLALPMRSLAANPDPSVKVVRGPLQAIERSTEPEIAPASDEAKLAIAHMHLPPGLVATLWAAEPMLANPVAFNFDEHGRIFVAETFRYRTSELDIRDYMWMHEDELANRNQDDFLATIRRSFGEEGIKELSKESERLVLLEDTNGDGTADKSTVYADDFRTPLDGIAAGVLARRGDVWFSNIPALWKFTGHDRAETRTALLRGFGIRYHITGHDFHGLIFGPDGKIYMSIGDRGAHVETKEGTVVDSQDCGAVFRCNPDGTHFELFATGLRNPQSLAFNEAGDLFTGDNDCDWGDEERLVHVVEGGDSGWRIGYQFAPRENAGEWNAEKLWWPRHPGQPAYLLAPICNIEDGPSGIAYYPGTGLTPAFAGNLFITHFKGSIANSGIYTYKMKPAGASYAIDTSAAFLTGALPTDVRFGPDGKLYYSDWAEGWPKSKRGRIYAIFDPKRANDPLVKQTQTLIAGDWTTRPSSELAALLAHPDWRVRLEAQFTLVDRGESSVDVFADVAARAESPLARRHAIWGLGQLAEGNPRVLSLLRALLQQPHDEVREQSARLLGDHHDTGSAGELVGLLRDPSARVQFFAAQSLGKLKVTTATPALLDAVRANNDVDAYLRHALVMGLVGCATPGQLTGTSTDKTRAVRLAAVLALRRLRAPSITTFLHDADPDIVRETALAISDTPIVDAYSSLAAMIARPITDEATMLRVLNVNFRLGAADNASALVRYAALDDAPVALRKEALALLAEWPAPSMRDRIVGVYRPLADRTRPTRVVVDSLLSVIRALVAENAPPTIATATINTAIALHMTAAIPTLRAVVRDPARSEVQRARALDALEPLGDPDLRRVVKLALHASAPALRLAALPISIRLNPDSAVATIHALLEQGSAPEQQASFKALGGLSGSTADDEILTQLGRLAAGEVAVPAQLDLVDAAARRSDPRVKNALAARESALLSTGDPLAPFRLCLEGGDARAGLNVFTRNPIMQCVRCHRYNSDPGSEVGPNLAGIGSRESREYILQSIIKPSARIAAGYEVATITLNNGRTVGGTIVQRNPQSLRVRTGENETIEIPQSDIKNVDLAPSGMPEIAATVLTKAEIRDLVATVSSFKKPAEVRDHIPLRALQPFPDTPETTTDSGH